MSCQFSSRECTDTTLDTVSGSSCPEIHFHEAMLTVAKTSHCFQLIDTIRHIDTKTNKWHTHQWFISPKSREFNVPTLQIVPMLRKDTIRSQTNFCLQVRRKSQALCSTDDRWRGRSFGAKPFSEGVVFLWVGRENCTDATFSRVDTAWKADYTFGCASKICKHVEILLIKPRL